MVGIHDEVRDDLADLARVDLGRPEIGAKEELAPAMRTTKRKADSILDQFANRRGFLNRSAAAGESKKLLRQIAGAHRSVLRVIQTCPHLVVVREKERGE